MFHYLALFWWYLCTILPQFTWQINNSSGTLKQQYMVPVYSKWPAPTIGGRNGAEIVATTGEEYGAVDDTATEPACSHIASHVISCMINRSTITV